MGALTARKHRSAGCPQPNDLDRFRIERALQGRVRYRYVSPQVVAVDGGYRIQSPNCSRNIAADGGVIDIALLLYNQQDAAWSLYRKNHAHGDWQFTRTFPRLAELLDSLNADPDRQFWQ